MKLIAHDEGRALQLVSGDELRPLRGGVFPPDAIGKLVAKYRFQKYPTSFEASTTLKFEIGVIEINDITIPITTLEIYSDGFLVVTRNTDDSDLAMDQLMEWGKQELGFRKPTTIVPRKYVSRMIIDFENKLEALLPALEIFNLMASEAFEGRPVNLSVVNIQVGPFPPTQYPYQTTWQLARRTADPITPLRYVSQAPLASAPHLDFLATLEHRLHAK